MNAITPDNWQQFTTFTQAFPYLWLSLLALFGAIIGSFLNVVIYRLPLMLERHWQQAARHQLGLPALEDDLRFNLCLPHSHCPHCHRPLALRDNIPLFSWLWLRGRARCCRAKIAYRYPLVELSMALLSVLAGMLIPVGLPLAGILLLMAYLLTLGIIDAQKMLLPDVLTLPLMWAGLLFNLSGCFVPLEQAVIGAITGYLCLWGLFWIFKLSSGKDALGYGDFKLLAALGAWGGWRMLPHLLLAAACSAILFVILRRWLTHSPTDRPLAFGPWLAAAGGLMMLTEVLPQPSSF